MHISLFVVLFFSTFAFSQVSRCPGGYIQKNLRYNSSDQAPVFPFQQDFLADEVCCASFKGFPLAEPQGFFSNPGTLLQSLSSFKEKNGDLIFYDSVCGLPVFHVTARNLNRFLNETNVFGWPSFRPADYVKDNMQKGNNIYSKCGTYLGTIEPDNGIRYCIDLTCISGNPNNSLSFRAFHKKNQNNNNKNNAINTNNNNINANNNNNVNTGFVQPLVTFNPANKGTFFPWKITNDPVMGGVSSSTFTIDKSVNVSIFNGTVRIVPSLKAPGFCTVATNAGLFSSFNDISNYTHIMIKARTTTPQYPGYKVSICADTWLPCQFYSYKSNFNVTSNNFEWISIPYSDFSNDWSSFTGDCFTVDPDGTQHYCCDGNDQGLKPVKKSVCMTKQHLMSGVKQVGIWSEGHAGDFHIEVMEVGAGFGSSDIRSRFRM